MKKALASLAVLSALAALPAAAASPSLWTDLDTVAAASWTGERLVEPARARLVRLDRDGLVALLARAPSELAEPRGRAEVELAIPSPDGGERRYRVVDSPIMAPELAERYPEVRTFRLIDLDPRGLGGRGDWTPQGFHAVVRTPDGMFYVDPLLRGDDTRHQVYWRTDLEASEPFHCEVEAADQLSVKADGQPLEGVGLDLRTYRLALAATGEYTDFHGGTVALGQAAIVTAMNRVNEIYERDVAIRMILVPNNDSVVYTDGGTDPYTNNSGSAMLGQNTTNLNNVIGSANYDIGHVFSTGGGGVATLSGPCGGNKARGVTGLGSPVGDAFYIDYVAHEMGHQWGGNHTFNGSSGSCSGGNRNGPTAYEPGSGSTIQAYAGICSPQNLQPNSDAIFHRVSLNEIQNFSRTGNGNTCAALLAFGNEPPTAEAGAAYTIPLSTPFVLTGSGSDSDGAGTTTYIWEEWDLGAAGAPNAPVGNAPIFRTFDSTLDPVRTFPKVQDLVNNTQTIGEILPTYARTLNFRFTVRDNDLPAGANAFDGTTVTVDATSGPFLVTDPNTALTWNGNGPHNVSWNVANTGAAPIACALVDIKLSTDGGLTFPQTLATAVPNVGNAAVIVITPDTTTARIQVMCSGNIFFDISNANFTIAGAASATIFEDGFESGDVSAWSLIFP